MLKENTNRATALWNVAANPLNDIRRYRHGYDGDGLPGPPLYRVHDGGGKDGPTMILMLHSAVGEHPTPASPHSKVRRRKLIL